MQQDLPIQYVRRQELDEKKWDACIASASNGLIYAYSLYLDHMVDHWDALVLDDYKAVMPLPWRKKWGIHYLYQPFLTAQLGIFGNDLKKDVVNRFLKKVPHKFRYWDMSLNHQNLFSFPDFSFYERNNFILPLSSTYEELYKGYRENIRRNIKKSQGYGCTVCKDVNIESIIELTKFHGEDTPEKDFQNFIRLFKQLKQLNMAKTYGILSSSNHLLASAAFLFSHKRAYYILVGNHPNGRTLGASHALIDAFIKDHAQQDLFLDFEGSDLRNLAFFYSSFGAKEEKYAAIKLNRLPWWARWLKS